MQYVFKASKTFWRKFYRLPSHQKDSVRAAWNLFKRDPFHPSLGVHKINALSAAAGKTVLAVEIEGNLRTVFYIEGNVVNTFDIGDHSVYKSQS